MSKIKKAKYLIMSKKGKTKSVSKKEYEKYVKKHPKVTTSISDNAICEVLYSPSLNSMGEAFIFDRISNIQSGMRSLRTIFSSESELESLVPFANNAQEKAINSVVTVNGHEIKADNFAQLYHEIKNHYTHEIAEIGNEIVADITRCDVNDIATSATINTLGIINVLALRTIFCDMRMPLNTIRAITYNVVDILIDCVSVENSTYTYFKGRFEPITSGASFINDYTSNFDIDDCAKISDEEEADVECVCCHDCHICESMEPCAEEPKEEETNGNE